MLVPILKQEHCLIASIQGELSDAELLLLRDQLVAQVRQHRSRGVVIDVTVLDIMDSFAARTLRSIAQMTKLLGAQTVIAGIQPEVAMSMVQLGLTLDHAMIAMDLEDGLALLRTRGARENDVGHQP
ncbi:STAS domain-containing protein [Noviherbaspirillum autotrophicum]|jgi:rsbT antagonist protein RsbS|uniref:Anti-sigma factor antagonist n=1 Tax=Noviherbaspirillum autotrophicum TaxID=709839 RepID=A0A0C2BT66_9BURK|nr:STAS domain-containing protein [Noviherbaspirillum autotrophicum]KIF83234.1 anti-sigma factor antagonist [Noviherbaspirillum autotrophicum]